MGTKSHEPPAMKDENAWRNPHDAGPAPTAPGARPGVPSRIAMFRERMAARAAAPPTPRGRNRRR